MTQETGLFILKTGANVFLTGEPGSGKTHTINRYVEYLRNHGIEPAITASTGIAATHIGGMTVHSWSGIGIQKKFSSADIEMIAGRKRIASRIAKTRVLIVDEISMLDARSLNAVEAVCRAVKQNSLPWGGMQAVFVGDFFQLPPIAAEGEGLPEFSFRASSFTSADPAVCYLSEQYRHEDGAFISMLSSIRRGVIDDKIHSLLRERSALDTGSRDVVRLYSHNADVDRVNTERLAALSGKEAVFTMESRGPDAFVSQLKKGCLSPETLRLKIGARVMFTKNNFREGFVNGTIGVVKNYTGDGNPLVEKQNKRMIEVLPAEWSLSDGLRTLAYISQLPLRLAWAITVHKSQGMTIDSAVVDLRDAFAYGQGYVALSRVRALGGLFLLGYNARSLEVDQNIIAVDGSFREQSHINDRRFADMSEGERAERIGAFLARLDVASHVAPRKKIPSDSRTTKSQRRSTYEETLSLWRQGRGINDIAHVRGITKGTVIGHLEELCMRGKVELYELRRAAPERILNSLSEIALAFRELGTERLLPVYTRFNGKYSYDEIRLVRIICSENDIDFVRNRKDQVRRK